MARIPRLRIGTRGSPLALFQANAVRARLLKAHRLDEGEVEVKVITTSGDRIRDQRLSELGGKGLFTKEIDSALAAGDIDLAVHSAKDMPSLLPDSLVIAACLEREDVRDVLVARGGRTFANLPPNARLGTASPRREAQARRLRPDLVIGTLRGNVETRLRKLDGGEFDATILAMAGLRRLGLMGSVTEVLSADDFLPAVGQGTIAIAARADDAGTRQLIAAIGHRATEICLVVERAYLAELEGSCRTPIAGHAVLNGDEIHFRGLILRPDGSESHEVVRTGAAKDAALLGADAGRDVKSKASAGFFDPP